MKRNKKQEKRRKKLRTLILLLFLTIIMFGTSTYAWFTANKMVTINSLDVHVEATGGIQISTDAAVWKSVITNGDINTGYTGHKNIVPQNVTAVSTDGKVDETNGTLNLYKSIIGNDASDGSYNIKTELETETAASTTAGDFIAFDVFLRVDEEKQIYLTSDSKVTKKGDGDDKGLKNAARVGFVMLGHTDSTATSAAMIAAHNLLNSSSKAIIWEPNYDTHSQLVTSQVATEYGVTLNTSGPTAYCGVNKAIPTPVSLKNLVNCSDTTNATSVTPNITTTAANTDYKQAFTLQPGVTKVRVYMWIEGQDIDCENNATGSDISYTVQLSTESSATGTGN